MYSGRAVPLLKQLYSSKHKSIQINYCYCFNNKSSIINHLLNKLTNQVSGTMTISYFENPVVIKGIQMQTKHIEVVTNYCLHFHQLLAKHLEAVVGCLKNSLMNWKLSYARDGINRRNATQKYWLNTCSLQLYYIISYHIIKWWTNK